jgi:NAD(P)-dependent dehydrogenase (short-subunit alcohol dehydrogenase family)
MGDYLGADPVRLLRSINAQQAHGRVGSIVFPFAAARSVALVPGMGRYEEALWAIVQVSSFGGQVAYPGFSAYCATKFALEGFSEALAAEVAPMGSRC